LGLEGGGGAEAGDDGDVVGAEGGIDDLEVAADAEPGGEGEVVEDFQTLLVIEIDA